MATMNKKRTVINNGDEVSAYGRATMARFMMVLCKDDMDRIKFSGENELTVDLHGLGAKASIILLNNIINLNRASCDIKVIHGFNHGTALKDVVNSRFFNPRIKGRAVVANNPGMTILSCKSAV